MKIRRIVREWLAGYKDVMVDLCFRRVFGRRVFFVRVRAIDRPEVKTVQLIDMETMELSADMAIPMGILLDLARKQVIMEAYYKRQGEA